MHLTPEALVDVLDGVPAETAVAHLQACESCRQQVAALRSAMSAAAADGVPEPSPLFWEHFAARVRTAVEVDDQSGSTHRRWPAWPLRWSAAAAVGVVAALALAVYMTAPDPIPGAPVEVSEPGDATAAVDLFPPLAGADDPSLILVASLTADMDPEAVAEAAGARAGGSGTIERMVADLTDDERLELRRLLEEAMENRGA